MLIAALDRTMTHRRLQFIMRAAIWLSLPFGADMALARECIVAGPRPRLEAETVDWSFVIPSGESCVRGLRSNAMTIDSVSISSPPKSGDAAVRGYGFVYTSRSDFKGEDGFALSMSGRYQGFKGTSTIRVRISVR